MYIEILQKLVSYKSITPSDDGSLSYVSQYLQSLGFSCDEQEFNGVKNIYAVFGKSGPNICFAGHLDIVPPGKNWSYDPFVLENVGENLVGRGVVDMKGAIACFFAAISKFLKKNNPNFRISVLLTCDEEGEAKYGTSMMLKHLKEKNEQFDFFIIGEPASTFSICDTILVGRRGSANFELSVKGIQGHVAYPQFADNPIHKMLDIAKKLKDYKFDTGNDIFDPTCLQITSIDTNNDVVNLIPAECKIHFNIRFNDLWNQNTLVKKIQDITNFVFISKFTGEAFKTKSHPFIEILRKEASIITKNDVKFSAKGGISDARFIKNYAPYIECGLLANKAHQVDESCKISDLQTLYNVYYNFLISFSKHLSLFF